MEINVINGQFATLSGMVLELSGNSGAGAVTSVTINGTGSIVTNATYVDSALTITKSNDLTTLSGSVVGHVTNTAIHVPTGGTNGQVLMMVNGAPAWVNPVTIYSCTTAPSGTQGLDGDIYLQM